MCHREGGGTEVVALWNAPSTLHILDLLSTPNSSTGTQDGRHRIWEVFSLSGPPPPPRGDLSFTIGQAADTLVKQGCTRLGKNRRDRERTF